MPLRSLGYLKINMRFYLTLDIKQDIAHDTFVKSLLHLILLLRRIYQKKDPTISSMLVMLDAIDLKFKEVEFLWERLKRQAITFYFLPIKDMGLTDELYIKMNSRGKPLTRFENFKAELEQCIKTIDVALSYKVPRYYLSGAEQDY